MKIIFSILLICFSTILLGQEGSRISSSRVDSLKNILTVSQENIKLSVLLELCSILEETTPEECFPYAQQAFDLANKLNRFDDKVQACIYQGRVHLTRGDYSDALHTFKKALQLSQKVNFGKGQANALNEIGITYFKMASYDKALDFYYQSLRKADEIDFKERKIGTLNNIAIIYSIYKNYEKALEIFNNLLDTYESDQDSIKIALTLGNLALLYDEFGDQKKGLEYCKKSISIFERSGQLQLLANSLNSLGEMYLRQYDLNQANRCFNRAYKLSASIDYKRGVVSGLLNLGKYSFADKRYDLALGYFKKALTFALEDHDKEHIKDCYSGISKVYSILGDYKKALENTRNYYSYKDSIYNERVNKQITELQVQYEIETKEKEIEILHIQARSQKQLLILTLVGACLISLLVWYLLRTREKQLKQQNLLLEREKQVDKLEIEKKEAEKREKEQEYKRLQEEMKAQEQINRLKQEKYKEEIKHKGRELATNAMHIVNKNEILISIKKTIDNSMQGGDEDVRDVLKSLNRLVDSNISLDQEWDNFKMHFEQVHQGFFNRLMARFPELNTNDLRFCAYLRLNLDSKEIARILNISVNAIEKRRYRLRKKLQLKPNEGIFEYLSKL